MIGSIKMKGSLMIRRWKLDRENTKMLVTIRGRESRHILLKKSLSAETIGVGEGLMMDQRELEEF